MSAQEQAIARQSTFPSAPLEPARQERSLDVLSEARFIQPQPGVMYERARRQSPRNEEEAV